MERRLLTVDEVAEITGLTSSRVYTMLRDGILPGVKLGRQVRVDREALESWVSNGGKAFPGGWRKKACTQAMKEGDFN